MNDEILTVSELNQYIKDVLNAGFPQVVWLCGEIQGYNRNRMKSHVFFELIEKDPASKDVKAKIGLVVFANRKAVIQQILKDNDNPFELKDDIEVKFACKVDFYPPHGSVRLVVESIDPTYTLGKLALEKQKLIKELKEKGILDANKKAELPEVPLNIGLITSDDSAACNDFLSELKRSGFGFNIYLRNALMQGTQAPKDIVRAVKELNKMKTLDVIVITRGGGSISDLSCFDSEQIASAVAESRLPVLSGIGHEINLTITDLAAHTYAKTPTAIAQFIAERVSDFNVRLEERMAAVCQLAQEQVAADQQRLKDQAFYLQKVTQGFVKGHYTQVIQMMERIKQRPFFYLKEQERRLAQQRQNVSRTSRQSLQDGGQRLRHFAKLIEMAHPAKTMKRGFSITRNADGKAVKNASEVQSKEHIITEVANGLIKSITI